MKKQAARREDAEPPEAFSSPAPPRIVPAEDAADADSAIATVRRALAWQLKEIRMKPSKDTKAAVVRARDARTMADLVRTLERLDALEKRREGKNKKTKAVSDADVKQQLVRRLDQLLAAGATGGVPGKPQRG